MEVGSRTGTSEDEARCRQRLAHERMGRPMKVGKEDLIGILAAVEWYLAQDHAAIALRCESMVAHLVRWGAARSDVEVVRDFPGEEVIVGDRLADVLDAMAATATAR